MNLFNICNSLFIFVGYVYKTNSTCDVFSDLNVYNSLEEAINGCNKDVACKCILDSQCESKKFMTISGSVTYPSNYGDCTRLKKIVNSQL